MPTTASKRLLRSLPLHRRAEAGLREAVSTDDLAAFQQAFVGAIAKPLHRLKKKLGNSPLLAMWSEDNLELNGRERELAVSLDELSEHMDNRRGKKKNSLGRRASRYEEIIASWLAESGGAYGPWESIVIAEILLREARRLSPERFTEALGILADATLREPQGGLFDGSADMDSDNDDAIRQVITQGESAWTCSLLLSPLGGTQALQKSAAETLQKVLTESCDENGLVHGSLLRRLPEWLAPLTRCTIWADAFRQTLWGGDTATRMASVTERATLLLLPAANHTEGDTPKTLQHGLRNILEVLLPSAETTHERRLQKLVDACNEPAGEVTRPPRLKKIRSVTDEVGDTAAIDSDSKMKPEGKPDKPAVSWQSDLSCLAILRSSLTADADLLTLEWHSSDAQLMLAAAGVPLLDGHWAWSVLIDDEVVPSPSTWKCSCWFLDPETVFVELEGEDCAPVKRVRQLLLAPHDRFAMMTDTVTSKDPNRRVQLETSVRLVDGARCTTDPVTRELTLTTGIRSVRTFPLWLEDDRVQHSLGSYREQNGQLEMVGVGRGGVTLPLALDWHPERIESPADWASLTVTESRRIVGAHEAGSYRIRIGDHQVLLYRSLQAGQNSRAVLGLHTWDESVYSRVPSKGGLLKPLVEVEGVGTSQDGAR